MIGATIAVCLPSAIAPSLAHATGPKDLDNHQVIDCYQTDGPARINEDGVNCVWHDQDGGTSAVTFSGSDGTFVSGGPGTPTPYDTCTPTGTGETSCGVTYEPGGSYPAGGNRVDHVEVTIGTPASSGVVESNGIIVVDDPTNSVTCSPASVAVGATTTCTAVVSGAAPKGQVGFTTFGDGTFSPAGAQSDEGLCTLAVGVVGGVDNPRCTVTYTPAGTGSATRSDKIAVDFGGDVNNGAALGSTNVAVPVVGAGKTATTTTVKATPNPGKGGHRVTLTATVAAAGATKPTGHVAFTVDGASVSGCTSVALTTGVAKCSHLLAGGSTYHVVASYLGTSSFSASSSSTLTLKVAKQKTTTTLSVKVKGHKVALIAAVSGSGAGAPTGHVEFGDGGKPIAKCKKVALSSADHAKCTITVTTGHKNFEAGYLGSAHSATSGVTKSVTVK